MFKAIWRHELAMAERGGFAEMGSFVSHFGITQRAITGNNKSSTLLGNYIVGGPTGGSGGRWMFEAPIAGGGVQRQAFETIEDGMNWRAGVDPANANKFYNQTTGVKGFINKGRYAAGIGSLNAIGILTPLITGASAMSAYSDARNKGGSFLKASGAAAVDVGMSMLTTRMLSLGLSNPVAAVAVVAAAGGAYSVHKALEDRELGNRYLRQSRQSSLGGFVSGSMHTRQASTMRQRAMQSMQSSAYNTMRALGNEASFIHMPKSRYGNSTYGAHPTPILGY